MPTITFRDNKGNETSVDAVCGQSLMEAATKNAVAGIDAICGGGCACATCRVYVPSNWMQSLGEIKDMEADMIEYSGDDTAGVRLSCQITVTDALDGLVVDLPECQEY